MRELEKHWPNIFQVTIHAGLLCLWTEAPNPQFYCTGVIIDTFMLLFMLRRVESVYFKQTKCHSVLPDASLRGDPYLSLAVGRRIRVSVFCSF